MTSPETALAGTEFSENLFSQEKGQLPGMLCLPGPKRHL